MRFTFEDKVKIYKKRKHRKCKIKYLVRLVDKHGLDILRYSYHDYSIQFKEATIYRVLPLHESIMSISIDLGLSTDSLLFRWLKNTKKIKRPNPLLGKESSLIMSVN